MHERRVDCHILLILMILLFFKKHKKSDEPDLSEKESPRSSVDKTEIKEGQVQSEVHTLHRCLFDLLLFVLFYCIIL